MPFFLVLPPEDDKKNKCNYCKRYNRDDLPWEDEKAGGGKKGEVVIGSVVGFKLGSIWPKH